MRKNNKVLLFLDFDGVTHPRSAGGDFFRKTNMHWLEKALLENSNIRVVLSTSWREPATETLEEFSAVEHLKNLKGFLGPIVSPRIIGMNPIIDDPFVKAVRSHEALLYLELTNNKTAKWFALDDTKGFYLGHEDRVIWCDPLAGMTQKQYEEIDYFLNADNLPVNASRTKQIIHSIFQIPTGKYFTNTEFIRLGSISLVNNILAQMALIHVVERISRGAYIRYS